MGQLTSKSEVILQDDLLKSTTEYQSKLIDKVLEKKKFHLYNVTEFGHFGPTINIKYSLLENEYAVKILKQENIGPEELQWYELYNENIHSLISIEFVENIDVFLFYTETWNYSLKELMEHKLLQKRKDGMTMALKWLKEVANGLSYLHKKNFFHLNISTDNIVITDNDIAKIRNFHFICSRKAFNKKRYGLPMQFAPPEIFRDEKDHFNVNPEKYDIWSYGILVVNIFTGEELSRKLLPTPKLWTYYIYPVIYKVLQLKTFKQLVKKSFPTSYKALNLRAIRTTAAYILNFYHRHRPPASEITHLLNTLGVELQLQDGNIWNKRAPFEPLEREIKCMSFERKSSVADKKEKIYSGVGFEIEDILDDTSAKVLYADVQSNADEMGDFNRRRDPYTKYNEIFRDNTDSEISCKEKCLDSNVTLCDEKLIAADINLKEKSHDSNGTYCAEKQNSITDKTGKRTDENDKEYATRNNITAKGVFCKFVSWALEEIFYSGIKHNESFINKLSKSLTG